MQIVVPPYSSKKIISKILLTVSLLLFVVISFAQVNANKDTPAVNAPVIKVTLLGTGSPPPVMKGLAPAFLCRPAVKLCCLMQGVVVYRD
jgi:hypothetical protein